ncbi:liver-expressed antimicrobial peptide 2 [Ciconia maguari]
MHCWKMMAVFLLCSLLLSQQVILPSLPRRLKNIVNFYTSLGLGYKQVYFNRACYDLKMRKISSSSLKTTDLSISTTTRLHLPRAPDSHATTLFQTDCAALHRRQPRLMRQRRMTPFWRGVSLRPVGASCRDNSECITMLCRKNRCFLRTALE